MTALQITFNFFLFFQLIRHKKAYSEVKTEVQIPNGIFFSQRKEKEKEKLEATAHQH